MSGAFNVPRNIHQVGYGAVDFGDDSKLYVRFFRKSIRNNARSDQEGRPIYEGVDFIEIRQPGEKDALHRPVTSIDKMRFQRQWQAYEAAQDQEQAGMPLALLFDNRPELIDMMKALRIHTVEQLAGLTEQGIQRLGMGGRSFVTEAKEFVDQMGKAAGLRKLKAELEMRDTQIRTLESQLREVGDRLASLEGAKT